MAKIEDDKYYTDKKLAKRLIDTTYRVLKKNDFSRIVEPAAGGGAFSSQIDDCIAYDIKPEGEGIIEQDYLTKPIKYIPNSLTIGNPPFGSRNNLSKKFYNKACNESDFIAFIQPISQLNNSSSLYKFDLIHSEDLGKIPYSDRTVHCCFNVYRRPSSGKLNKHRRAKAKGLLIDRYDRGEQVKGKENHIDNLKYTSYDFYIVSLGWGELFTNKDSTRCQVLGVSHPDQRVRDHIKENLEGYINNMNHTTTRAVRKHQIVKFITDKFPEYKEE